MTILGRGLLVLGVSCFSIYSTAQALDGLEQSADTSTDLTNPPSLQVDPEGLGDLISVSSLESQGAVATAVDNSMSDLAVVSSDPEETVKGSFLSRVGSRLGRIIPSRQNQVELQETAEVVTTEIIEPAPQFEATETDLTAVPRSFVLAAVDQESEGAGDLSDMLIPAESKAESADRSGFLGRVGTGLGRIIPRRKKSETTVEYADLSGETLGMDAAQFFTPNETPVITPGQKLSLDKFLRLVAAKNDRIAYQRMEWAIARSGLDSARGLYEPALIASYRYTDSNTPNTTEEEFRRSFAPEFVEENSDYSVGVEGMVFTGAKVKVAYSYRQLDNNIQPAPIRGEEDKSYLGLSLTQPLLKGAGGRSVVSAPILVAEKEQGIALQTFRQAMFQTISNGAISFWDLYLAEKKLELRERSLEIAESILTDERERNRFGQSSETRVLSAESAVAQRRVQLYAGKQDAVRARSELRALVASMPTDQVLNIDTSGELTLVITLPDKLTLLENAFKNRPEYLASLSRAEKEDVRIKFARNNRLPQLDVVASYGLNGLDDSFSDSWDDLTGQDHETMYVGLEYKMLLLGDRKAKGELTAARLRRHQALLEIKAAEVSLHNSIDTAFKNLETSTMQVQELSSVADTNKRLLDVEMKRFEAGQSSSRDLLELEERLSQTMELNLESRINMQKAVVGISLADGTLLRQYGLEK